MCGLSVNFCFATHSISVHGSSRMEVPRHSNRVGADHPRTPVATSWTAVPSACSARSTSVTNEPPQRQSSGLRPFQDPSVKAAAAKERLSKLETALSAMDGMEGPEVDMVRNAYKRALEAVRGTPIDVQVKECESFLARARSHLEELDSKRATIIQNIESSEKRLEELRAQQTMTSPPDASSEVHQLRGRVAQLQAQVDNLRTFPSADCQGPNPKRTCSPGRVRSSLRRRDARVDRGATEGSPGGHSGQATPRGGEDLPTLVQGSASLATDHRRAGPRDAVCSGEHGEVIRVRCGMTGVPVGEAANPGPGQSRRRRRVSSSDDSDSHFDVGNPREGCAGRVPVDVLDALEEDLGVGEGEERVDAREDGSRNRFDRSECQGTVIDVDTDDEQSARAISDEDPVFRSVELGTVADSSIPVPSTMPAESPLPTWLDGNQSPRYARDESLVTGDRDSEHVVAVRASSTADAGGRMAVFARSSGRPKRLRANFTSHCSRSGEIEGRGVRFDSR